MEAALSSYKKHFMVRSVKYVLLHSLVFAWCCCLGTAVAVLVHSCCSCTKTELLRTWYAIITLTWYPWCVGRINLQVQKCLHLLVEEGRQKVYVVLLTFYLSPSSWLNHLTFYNKSHRCVTVITLGISSNHLLWCALAWVVQLQLHRDIPVLSIPGTWVQCVSPVWFRMLCSKEFACLPVSTLCRL